MNTRLLHFGKTGLDIKECLSGCRLDNQATFPGCPQTFSVVHIIYIPYTNNTILCSVGTVARPYECFGTGTPCTNCSSVDYNRCNIKWLFYKLGYKFTAASRLEVVLNLKTTVQSRGPHGALVLVECSNFPEYITVMYWDSHDHADAIWWQARANKGPLKLVKGLEIAGRRNKDISRITWKW